VVEVQVPERVDILALVRAHLASLVAGLGLVGAGTVSWTAPGTFEHPVVLEEALDRGVGGDGRAGRIGLQAGGQVVGVELVTPTGMSPVLGPQPLGRLGRDGPMGALIGAEPTRQRLDGVLDVAGGMVPAFESREAELDRLAGERMTPGLGGQRAQPLVQLSGRRRSRQQLAHHAEAKVGPALGGASVTRIGQRSVVVHF